MNVKKWLIASVVAFVALSIMEYILHGQILASAYMEKPALWASEAARRSNVWALYVGYLVYTVLFTLI